MAPPQQPLSSPLTELVTRVMRIGRRCPEATEDILEIMLLVSQIQAQTVLDHGYRHAHRVIARLRHPLWDDLTVEERGVLHLAADAIQRACRLDDHGLSRAQAEAEAELPERKALKDGLSAAFGDELSEAQIARIAGTVLAIMQERQ
jgi:uncharacterized protein YjiS (DUF1127 family)